MAENKKSFLLYCDIESTVEILPDEMAGKLFKTILRYVNDRNPIVDDLALKLAFEPIKVSLKRDLIKYNEIREKRSENGKRGGRPRKQEEPKKANGLPENQTKPKKAVSVIVSDSVNVHPTGVSKETPQENLIGFQQAKRQKTTYEALIYLLDNEAKLKEELCLSAGTTNWAVLKAFALTKANEYKLSGAFEQYNLGGLLTYISRDWKDPAKNVLAKSSENKPKVQRPDGERKTR